MRQRDDHGAAKPHCKSRFAMKLRLPRGLRWLYPGMRIKRWVALTVAAMGLFVFGLLALMGKEMVRDLYRFFPYEPGSRYIFVGLSLAIGIIGFGYGVHRLVRSVASGIAPSVTQKPSDIIYRTRILSRGPRVVAFGGGTGLATLLRGLKEYTMNITAVVTVMDDGGSSGRLRTEYDVLPAGDIRNCILSLAEDEQRMSYLFQHRFRNMPGLENHSLGNLIIAGLEQAMGGFDRAIEEMSHVLNIRGQVLPVTLEKVHLLAEMADGALVKGESAITNDPRQIVNISLLPSAISPYQKVLTEIDRADLIIVGPGSLFTSLIPNLLIEGIAAAITTCRAEKFYIANLMTQPGETSGFNLYDHLRALDNYIAVRSFDAAVINTSLPAAEISSRYQREGALPVINDLPEENEYDLRVIELDLLEITKIEEKLTVKHDPVKLSKAIANNTRAFLKQRTHLT